MIKAFLLFNAAGVFLSWRGWLQCRAYNRKMWTSMQKGPEYLWPLFIFEGLGTVAALGIRFIQLNP